MLLTIEKYQVLCEASKIKWTTHGLERMQERNIKLQDVKNCIMTGEIIEEYLEDFPHPSCLIFGRTIKNRVLHVVAGLTDECIFIITAYYPNMVKFEKDLKTRRV